MGNEFRSFKNSLRKDEQLSRIVSLGGATNGFLESWAELQHGFPLFFIHLMAV
jgi:hypothetical protein